jgi:CRP-like cAMP-binding protein
MWTLQSREGTGTAMRMGSAHFRGEVRKNFLLQRELLRFTHSLMAQISQTAACNRFHMVGQRLARWLLMTRDRVRSNHFRLTHEFLAHMLGVRRIGVTQATSILQQRKLISYSRGHITILDEAGLAAAACGCYEAVKTIYSRASR